MCLYYIISGKINRNLKMKLALITHSNKTSHSKSFPLNHNIFNMHFKLYTKSQMRMGR